MESIEAKVLPLLAQFPDQPYLQPLLVVIVTLLLAKGISWILLGILKRLAGLTRAQFDDALVDALKTPLFYTILMTGFSIAVHLLPLSEPSQHLTIALLQTIGIFVWMRFAISLSRSGLQALAADPHRFNYIQAQTLPLFENLMVLLIIAIALYLIFISWGIDMSAWLASAGIVGIAVGFAAKDTLANLFSGVLILADSPYKIGDYIVLDSGERGAVTHIGIRSTRMLTRDDVELTIPNSIMGNAKVINESGGPHPKYRIRVPVGAAYGSDVEQVRQLLTSIAEQDSLICSDPAPRVRFRALGGSSLDFELLCWVDEPGLRGQAVDHLLTAIYNGFNQEGIEIPYSKQDLYIKETPPLERPE